MICLITGSNGLLGQKLVDNLKNYNYTIIATSLGENKNPITGFYTYQSLDITKKEEVENMIKQYSPDVIFNTAAMTNVDLCEDDKNRCDNVNTHSVSYLAEAALKENSHLIHISTDFVFDGRKDVYSEDDTPNPLSYYGKSKLNSEKILLNHSCKWSILRTIVIYGVGENLEKNNIVLWAKNQLEQGNPLNIVDDEYRALTFAEDLAEACVRTAQNKVYGLMNICGKEMMSIFEIVERVAKFYNFDTSLINRIQSKQLNQKAKRPPKTSFDLTKAKNEINYSPKSFEESLQIIDKQLLKTL